MTREADILRAVRLAVSALPGVVVWRNSVGAARYPSGRRPVAYGMCRGASDLVAIIRRSDGAGVFAALEVKSARGRVAPDQQLFLDLVRRMGGFAAVVRSPEEAVAAVARARAGASE